MEPHDLRRPLEGAEHDGDATVLAQVRDRLDTATGLVQIGHGVVIDDGELLAVPLGRAVHRSSGVERRGGDEEDGLGDHPRAEPLVDRVVPFAHLSI